MTALGQRRLKILVYQLGFIGDTVVSIPALRALQRHYGPTAEICLLHETADATSVSPADVLAGTGLVSRFLSYRSRKGRLALIESAVRLWARLVVERFDEVVYLAPSERPASAVRRDALFFRLCGVVKQRGFISQDAFNWSAPPGESPAREGVRPEALRKLDRLAASGIEVSADDMSQLLTIRLPALAIQTADRWLAANRRYPQRPLVAISPSSKNPSNWWPIERFVEIGRRILALERFEIVVVGGQAERGAADQMLAAWGDGVSAAGALTVLGSGALLSRCDFMLGLDTGLTHLAGALGVGGVALYGGRDPIGLWDPFGGRHKIVRHPVPCAGCRAVVCPLEDHPCMRGIEVEHVWAALRSFVAGSE